MCGTGNTARLEKPVCVKNHCSPVDMSVLLQSAGVFTLETFDGLSLLVFALGKPQCVQYLFITKTVLWMVSVLWAHIPHI